MKQKIIIAFLLASVGCNYSKVIQKQDPSPASVNSSKLNYKVYKIDSLNSFYLIYAKRNDSIYKIVSKKPSLNNFPIIVADSVYEFKLHARSENRTIQGEKILQQNSLLVNCFSFDDTTKICLERDSINDLHYAENLRGLSFINK